MLKREKSQYLNSIFELNYTRYKQNVIIQNCLLQKGLQSLVVTFFYKICIILFDSKQYY